MKRSIINVLGTLVMFGSYYLIARLIQLGLEIQADRALILVTLYAVSQGRWFQDDKSPLTQPDSGGK